MRHLYGVPLIILLIAVAYSSGCGSDASPDASHTASRAPTARPQTSPSTAVEPLYIAVGDSLSYGSAASDPDTTSFVALVHRGFTIDIDLLNLGVPGYTSADLLSERELDIAIGEISARLNDGIEGNEVEAVTFEIGGNDLLSVYFDFVIPETCTSVDQALANDKCVNALIDVLDEYGTNLDTALAGLRATDPDLPIFVLTLYNPFSGRDPEITRIGDLAIEGEAGTPFEEGINDIIRDVAPRYDVHLVEIFPIFDGRAQELVAFDLIHPNDDGYALMADAVLTAMSDTGLPVAGN
jgi:lysophospholipase L1-like esterase